MSEHPILGRCPDCFSKWNTENDLVKGYLPLDRKDVHRKGFAAGIGQNHHIRDLQLERDGFGSVEEFARTQYRTGGYTRGAICSECLCEVLTLPFYLMSRLCSFVAHECLECTVCCDDYGHKNYFWKKTCIYYHCAACGDLCGIPTDIARCVVRVSCLGCGCLCPALTGGPKTFDSCPDFLEPVIFYQDLEDLALRRGMTSTRISKEVRPILEREQAEAERRAREAEEAQKTKRDMDDDAARWRPSMRRQTSSGRLVSFLVGQGPKNPEPVKTKEDSEGEEEDETRVASTHQEADPTRSNFQVVKDTQPPGSTPQGGDPTPVNLQKEVDIQLVQGEDQQEEESDRVASLEKVGSIV